MSLVAKSDKLQFVAGNREKTARTLIATSFIVAGTSPSQDL
jgi:hypothetical protein